jgi:hypothetical protein
MLIHSSPSRLAALALSVLLPALASGQTRIEVGPLLALYAPAGGFQPAPYYSTALPNAPSALTSAAVGGQGRIWFGRRLGLQLHVAWASTRVGGGATPAGTAPSTPATVLTTSAQALFALSPWSQRAQLWFSAGAGLVRHGGKAYAPYGSPVQLATALGIGSAIPLGRHLSANLGVTTLLYNIDVSDSTGTSLEHGFQVDPLFHLGFSVRWP